jgi:DNA ligase (NAD+)
LDIVSQLSAIELASVDGIGSELSVNVSDWFAKNKHIVEYFNSNNIAVSAKPSLKKSDILEGKSFIMTGSFADLDRDVFKDLVIEYGGKVASGISKKVQFCLLGSGAGPKKISDIAELQRNGVDIKIIDDKQFLSMIGK